MQVFKFGGASVKDVSGVKNLTKIVRSFEGERVVIVVSAMGKTTNKLEELVSLAHNQQDYLPVLDELLVCD